MERVISLRECIQGTCKFQFCRDSELYYKCQNGFIFKVYAGETQGACFLPEDKGIFFMRWIREALEKIKAENG